MLRQRVVSVAPAVAGVQRNRTWLKPASRAMSLTVAAPSAKVTGLQRKITHSRLGSSLAAWLNLIRITSYNVCYTKLLRSFASVARGLLGGGLVSLVLSVICAIGLAMVLMHSRGPVRFLPLLAGLLGLYAAGKLLMLSPLIV